MQGDGIRSKNVPQSYYDAQYSKVTDEEELYDLKLWLQDEDETIME